MRGEMLGVAEQKVLGGTKVGEMFFMVRDRRNILRKFRAAKF
jgi:hypothetical protein